MIAAELRDIVFRANRQLADTGLVHRHVRQRLGASTATPASS